MWDQSLPQPVTSHPSFGASVPGETTRSKLGILIKLSIAAVLMVVLLGGAAIFYSKWMQKNPIQQTVTAPPVKPVSQETIPAKHEMAKIEGGTFQMGRSDVNLALKIPYDLSQYPAHPVSVNTFWMDKTEVTNSEYADFVRSTRYSPPGYWRKDAPPSGQEQWPVTNISFADVKAFADWRSRRDTKNYRLPTEAEWEYAARNGSQAALYPWGNQWLDDRANVDANSLKPVGSYPQGASRWGVFDLIGNVWEWTSSDAAVYPGNSDFEIKLRNQLIIRGGSYAEPSVGQGAITATRRSWVPPSAKEAVIGFRLVRSGP
jgi:formylglycine-generating enzyme required for sulfatase activity